MDTTANKLKRAVKTLCEENTVEMFLGYEKGMLPLRTRMAVIKDVDDTDRLVWDSFCLNSLAVYLPQYFVRKLRLRPWEEEGDDGVRRGEEDDVPADVAEGDLPRAPVPGPAVGGLRSGSRRRRLGHGRPFRAEGARSAQCMVNAIRGRRFTGNSDVRYRAGTARETSFATRSTSRTFTSTRSPGAKLCFLPPSVRERLWKR